MHYLVMAWDGEDEGALERRLAVREAHLASARDMGARGQLIEGGALLDEAGKMVGSMALVDFPDRAGVDGWLASDPYTKGDVWRKIEVLPVLRAKLR